MSEPVFEITKAAAFDAAHHLDVGPADERYRRLHGHSFEVEATVRGPLSSGEPWVADLGQLERALTGAAAELDHGDLNETPGLESPTLERLCLWVADRLKAEFPGLSRVTVSRPTVKESCTLRVEP